MKWRAVMLSGIGDDSSIHDGAVSNVPSSCSRVRAQHGRLICDRRTNSLVVTLNYHPVILMHRQFVRRLVITR